jgi:hypothetical protein
MMVEELLKFEMSLWINETRNSKVYLEKILHETYYAIGQDGIVINKTDILQDLSLELEVSFPFEKISIKEINIGTFLISYKVKYSLNGISRYTYQTSIWLTDNEEFHLLFHQETTCK